MREIIKRRVGEGFRRKQRLGEKPQFKVLQQSGRFRGSDAVLRSRLTTPSRDLYKHGQTDAKRQLGQGKPKDKSREQTIIANVSLQRSTERGQGENASQGKRSGQNLVEVAGSAHMVHRLGCGEVSSFQYQEEKGGPDWRGLQQPAIPTQKSKLYLTRGLVWGRVGNSR
ncbi:predicted protein [Histoplasma capsulatum G186AR]|uniref:Uncharacterized protein n=1 Tax=Ajellomyces capsulatus (strain G186AR / H82 / ATCC MYA-2454 / RMSCC 2432) TaxID=447093 RepID=C0NP45_AJECG|nr:uncharacterized protein HCBG_04925 [Histoplasma capsulatum G186AR]EEH06705.1 predicted protein [Histoplasma capsulatum G186AR]